MINNKITDSSFQSLVQRSYNEMRDNVPSLNRYAIMDAEELMGYMWLHPYETKLKYDIFVDDGKSYIRDNHPLLIFVRNGIGRHCDDFIPISVSNEPKILNLDMVVNIPLDELYRIKQFIITNRNRLSEFAKGDSDPNEFVENLERIQL